jgi:tetratricopeptide (TPR) repeat protein
MKNRARLTFFLASALAAASLLSAQAYRGKGRVKGTVTDTEGQPVAQATVKLFHVKSGSGFDVKTDDRGEWAGNWLRNGLWYIDFEKEGFIPKKISLEIHETMKNQDNLVSLKRTKAPVLPKELLDQLDKGNKLYAENKFDEAIAEYKAILANRPEFYQVNINIGNALMKKEDYAAALSSYQLVLEKDPTNAEALISSGNCHVELKDFAKALEAFSRIDIEDISDPVTLYNIALIFFENGDSAKAVAYWSQSVKVKSDFVDSYYQLGLAHLRQNESAPALEAFKKYLEFDAESERADQVRGFISYLEKK